MQEYIHILDIYSSGCYMFFLAVNTVYIIFRREHLYHVTGAVLLWWTFLSLISVTSYMPFAKEIPGYNQVLSILDLTAVPTMVFMLRALTGKRHVDTLMVISHESVYFILILLLILTGKKIFVDLALYFTIAYSLFYWILAFWVIKVYKQSILEYYSDLEWRNLNWLRHCIIAIPFILPAWYVMEETSFAMGAEFYRILSICVWSYLLYHIIKQRPVDLQGYTSHRTPVDTAKYPFAQRLESLCQTPAFFARPDLTIDDLASKLNVEKDDILRYIKNELHSSFYDLINEKRLDYAADILLSSHKSIEDISKMCGYNNINAFEAAFKDNFYCTPTEYRTIDDSDN